MGSETNLSEGAIEEQLAAMPGWLLEGGRTITKTFHFPDFVQSIQFVNRLAEAAEDAQHHPDIDIRYDRVKVALSTHDSGGITRKDFLLAEKAEEAASASRRVA